jgi:MerR family regulatory protein
LVNSLAPTTLDLPVQGKVKAGHRGGTVKIGELSAATGTTTKTLRFYDTSGLLPATGRTANGYRDYGPDALARLDFIRRGRTAGPTWPRSNRSSTSATPGTRPAPTWRTCSTPDWPTWTAKSPTSPSYGTVADLAAAAAASEPATCQPQTICRYL